MNISASINPWLLTSALLVCSRNFKVRWWWWALSETVFLLWASVSVYFCPDNREVEYGRASFIWFIVPHIWAIFVILPITYKMLIDFHLLMTSRSIGQTAQKCLPNDGLREAAWESITPYRYQSKCSEEASNRSFWESNEVVERESVEYTEVVFQLVKAYLSRDCGITGRCLLLHCSDTYNYNR